MDERKRDSMIAYLRHRMEEFGITPDTLATALASDESEKTKARYRAVTGETWSGEGEMPQWLRQAISAGQSIEHFALSPKAAEATPAKRGVDWEKDPFAGSPLARSGGR
ncbi:MULTISPECIES: H-NS histone family protein [Paraburkholderia]|jgi:DNA-binding protein H-NS|uniref:DNA-binding protein H-NS n=1 Tax=Paraburkholderia phenazinium TaxID=60549 RepID=A0A1N6GAP7_9BURK|nr:H-NS histone family protein [Paraburkholderia phenazinium]SIO04620.1 DNA-binding protein H-NS [Paraburkholderia phenazinium]